MIAATTAVAAGFSLFFPLLSPPLGSTGLLWATLPAAVLAAALWFCHNDVSARLATYAIVASLFAVVFCGIYLSKTDWLFGHTRGPPQLTVVTFVSSMIGALTGGAWVLIKYAARRDGRANVPTAGGGESSPVRWAGVLAVTPLTLLSALLALGSFSALPPALKRMDNYVRQRQINAEILHSSHTSPEPPFTQQRQQEITAIIAQHIKQLDGSDPVVRRPAAKNLRAAIRNIREHTPAARLFDAPATQAALIDKLDDGDGIVRAYVAMAILELKDQAERSDRLQAIDVLGVPPNRAEATEITVMLLRTLEYYQRDEEYRCAVIRALGRMGRGADPAYRQIEAISLKGTAAERTAATEALTHIGPTAGK